VVRTARDSAGQVPSSSVVGGLRLTLVWADLITSFRAAPTWRPPRVRSVYGWHPLRRVGQRRTASSRMP